MIDPGLLSSMLALCEANQSGIEYLLNFDFIDALACPYVNEAGVLVVGLIIWGAVSMAIYVTTGDIRIPSVLLLIIGGVVVPQVAGPGLAIAVIMLLLLGAGIATSLYNRYSR